MREKRICSHCGKEFKGNFCPECGTKWEETPVPETTFEGEAGTDGRLMSANVTNREQDAPRSLDGKPALMRAHALVRWSRAVSAFELAILLLFGFGFYWYHDDPAEQSFRFIPIAFVVACVIGVVMYFLPVRHWKPFTADDDKYSGVWSLLKGSPEFAMLFSFLAAMIAVVFFIIATISNAAYKMFGNFPLTCLFVTFLLPLGLAGALASVVLRKRRQELNKHFYGVKKVTKETPLLFPYNEDKELAFLAEYKKNKGAIARYPIGTADVSPHPVLSVIAIVLAALSVVSLCIHNTIFQPFNVAFLSRLPMDIPAHDGDLVCTLGSYYESGEKWVAYQKGDSVRTTIRFNDGYISSIEMDCKYDAEGQEAAAFKEIVQRKILTDNRSLCGVPLRDVIMECTYKDGSYRKTKVDIDPKQVMKEMLGAEREDMFYKSDAWEEQYLLRFERIEELSGSDGGVEYTVTANYYSAILVLGGSATVTRVFNPGSSDMRVAYWTRFYPVTTNLTIKAGLSHADGAYDGMTDLERVVIEKGVLAMPQDAFHDSAKLAVIWCEDTQKPDDWHEKWQGDSKAVVHWGDEWEYVNGIPQLKENTN